jgi:hypothetical protein
LLPTTDRKKLKASPTVPETRSTISSKPKGGQVEKQRFPNLIQTFDLERRATILPKSKRSISWGDSDAA